MSSSTSSSTTSMPSLVGLDVVRVLAMVMVMIQHTFSLAGREDLTVLAGLSVGQLGVAIFLVVSGLLSFETQRTPTSWFWQRACRIYPAFWIAMSASFCLAALSGYKNASIGQMASQMLGTGLWTHPGELVNSPTWFVSLIMACYVATYLTRVVGQPRLLAAICSVGLTIMVARDTAPWLMSHFLTYAVASTIAASNLETNRKVAIILVAAAYAIMAVAIQPAFAYTALSVIVVELSLLFKDCPRAIRIAAYYSYEFYLVHGVALAGALTLLNNSPILAVIIALTASAVAAIVLNHLASFVLRQLRPAKPVITSVNPVASTINPLPQS